MNWKCQDLALTTIQPYYRIEHHLTFDIEELKFDQQSSRWRIAIVLHDNRWTALRNPREKNALSNTSNSLQSDIAWDILKHSHLIAETSQQHFLDHFRPV